MRIALGNRLLELVEGDITEMDTDAIVNAANANLSHGGGVAGAIVRKGGRIIQDESDKIGGTPVGTAVITTGGKLKTRHVIHAVGPRMGEGNEDEKLASATRSGLDLAEAAELKSIAFPAVSTGIFGYPIDRCARIMLSIAIERLRSATRLERIVFCLYGKKNYEVFQSTLEELMQDVKEA